jgi:hypothetical protein
MHPASFHGHGAASASASVSLPSVASFASYAAAPPPPFPLSSSIHPIATHPLSQSHPHGHPHAHFGSSGTGSSIVTSNPLHTQHPQATPSNAFDELHISANSYSPPYEPLPAFSPWQTHASLPTDSGFGRALVHPAYAYHPYPMPANFKIKVEEPILAPGELPAPRPPNSYAALIGEALLLAPAPHQLYVSEISDSIKKRYPCELKRACTPARS